jgi:hypothetical protein
MADYYSIIAKAVRTLDPNTGEARRRLYERARGALLAEMSSAALGLDKSDILSAQQSLEDAIRQVETELLRAEHERQMAAARQAAATRPVERERHLDGVVEAPGPPANQNGKRPGGPLRKLWTQVFRRPGDALANGHRRAGGEVLPSHVREPHHNGHGRDTWMSDLLARASLDEEEDFDQDFAPPRKVGRGA